MTKDSTNNPYAHYIEHPEEDFYKPISYVMAKNGCFEIRNTDLGRAILKAREVEGLESTLKEGIELQIPKIPGWILTTILDFFRAVYRYKNGAEAFLQVFYNREEDRFFLFCPKQQVSRARVRFERDPGLEEKHILVMDIHSHNSMSAFFSGVDDADEKEDRLFGVIGRVDQKIPQLKFRMGMAGRFVNLDGRALFGAPEASTSWPQEWLELCSQPMVPQHRMWRMDSEPVQENESTDIGVSHFGEKQEPTQTAETDEPGDSSSTFLSHDTRESWGKEWELIFSQTGSITSPEDSRFF